MSDLLCKCSLWRPALGYFVLRVGTRYEILHLSNRYLLVRGENGEEFSFALDRRLGHHYAHDYFDGDILETLVVMTT